MGVSVDAEKTSLERLGSASLTEFSANIFVALLLCVYLDAFLATTLDDVAVVKIALFRV